MAKEQRCPCRVTTAELAQALGATPDHIADRASHAGYVVAPDWAGRPSVAVLDAYAVALSMRAGLDAASQAESRGKP